MNIIPDASGTASMLPALTGRGQRRSARQRKEIERVYLWDVKSIHGGGLIYQSVRARDDQSGAVAQRAHLVNGGPGGGEYGAHAKALDDKINRINGTPNATAIASHLRTFTQVRGLAFGEYAEASEDVHALIKLAARALARKHWRSMGARDEKEARGWWTNDCRKRLGVAVTRAYARFRASRMTYIGMPRAVLNELKERRDAATATSGELYRPYGEDVHSFWLHQTLVRSGAD